MSWQHNTRSTPSEQELLKANKLLETENKSLVEMVQYQRDFIAKTVHEARSHVRFIFMGLKILFQIKNDPGREAEYGRMLYTLKESTLKYKNLLYNLTDYSFNEYGRKILVKMETVPVNDYIQSVVEDLHYYLAESGQPLKVYFASSSFEVTLDTMKFRQVIHNLIFNATQHGENGIINMVVTSDALDGTWTLSLSNPYKLKRKNEGSHNSNLGLGLLIAKQLIECMKGKLDIQRAEQLFTVTIRMPLPTSETPTSVILPH
ncbi:sensor histidine kinase [Pseudoflavitalea rhizosphaerae]|uniref:sensor histidine kinase n=1 Tax=Pseudoflavitalea rhizosphaerae TaxID=1884793 RepID=UPI000F8C43E7|nr:HAMP domain-containing sensor histidine kinase [Pseudoflavitalea rhizosphaerae]